MGGVCPKCYWQSLEYRQSFVGRQTLFKPFLTEVTFLVKQVKRGSNSNGKIVVNVVNCLFIVSNLNIFIVNM